MDVVVGAVIVTGSLALLAVISVLVVPGPLRLRLRGPFRTGLDIKAPDSRTRDQPQTSS